MILIGKPLLANFGRQHPLARGAIASWVAEAEAASWPTPQTIKARFQTASFVGSDRVVFNLKGNSFRLDVQINYAGQVILVRRIGTHSEYGKWTF